MKNLSDEITRVIESGFLRDGDAVTIPVIMWLEDVVVEVKKIENMAKEFAQELAHLRKRLEPIDKVWNGLERKYIHPTYTEIEMAIKASVEAGKEQHERNQNYAA